MYQNDSLTPDRLLVGANDNYVARGILCAGNQPAPHPRGAVLGAITKRIHPAVDNAGNAGNGTVGGQALRAAAKVTVYTLAALDPATFSVIDSDGVVYANATVGVAYAGPIAFLITAGLVPFVAGDEFTIAVTRPVVIEYRLVDSTSVDGSNIADCILGEDVDATGPVHVMAPAYFAGEFNERELTFGGVDTADDHRDTLRDKGIFMRYTTPA